MKNVSKMWFWWTNNLRQACENAKSWILYCLKLHSWLEQIIFGVINNLRRRKNSFWIPLNFTTLTYSQEVLVGQAISGSLNWKNRTYSEFGQKVFVAFIYTFSNSSNFVDRIFLKLEIYRYFEKIKQTKTKVVFI